MNDIFVKNKTLFEIDTRIDELVKKIELLNYVNPINIESEKELFFKISLPPFIKSSGLF